VRQIVSVRNKRKGVKRRLYHNSALGLISATSLLQRKLSDRGSSSKYLVCSTIFLPPPSTNEKYNVRLRESVCLNFVTLAGLKFQDVE